MAVVIERFDRVPLFEDLTSTEIADLLELMDDLRIAPGDVVMKEGDPGEGLYLISSGAFEVSKGTTSPTVLARLEQMSVFGEMSLVSRKPCAASVVCVAEARVKRFPVASFEKLLKNGDLRAYKVAYRMCRLLAERLAVTDQWVVSLQLAGSS